MTTKIIAVANQKGGVGKTTTVVNLAASLAHHGKRVLVIDLDPQGNATTGSGVDKSSIESGVYQVLLGEAEVKDAVIHSEAGGYDVLAANRTLAGAEVELVQEIAREMRLKNALEPVLADYDFVLIDCPPTLTLLTLNGLVAAEGVIVPMVCEYYALEGISDLVATVRKIRQAINPRLDILAIVRTLYDSRSRLSQEVTEQLQAHFGKQLFDTTIPRNVRLAEAPSHGLPALAYDAKAKGTLAYLALAEELLARS
mgnify:FL=1|jgi:chromosome partitioning protein